MYIAKRPLDIPFFGRIKEKEGEEALIVEFENGEQLSIEKFGPEMSSSSSSKNIPPNGLIEVHRCFVKGDKVYINNEIYKIMGLENCRNIYDDITGYECYRRISIHPKYEPFTTNCQHLTHNTFPEAKFPPQQATGDELKKKGTGEFINHLIVNGYYPQIILINYPFLLFSHF